MQVVLVQIAVEHRGVLGCTRPRSRSSRQARRESYPSRPARLAASADYHGMDETGAAGEVEHLLVLLLGGSNPAEGESRQSDGSSPAGQQHFTTFHGRGLRSRVGVFSGGNMGKKHPNYTRLPHGCQEWRGGGKNGGVRASFAGLSPFKQRADARAAKVPDADDTEDQLGQQPTHGNRDSQVDASFRGRHCKRRPCLLPMRRVERLPSCATSIRLRPASSQAA